MIHIISDAEHRSTRKLEINSGPNARIQPGAGIIPGLRSRKFRSPRDHSFVFRSEIITGKSFKESIIRAGNKAGECAEFRWKIVVTCFVLELPAGSRDARRVGVTAFRRGRRIRIATRNRLTVQLPLIVQTQPQVSASYSISRTGKRAGRGQEPDVGLGKDIARKAEDSEMRSFSCQIAVLRRQFARRLIVRE